MSFVWFSQQIAVFFPKQNYTTIFVIEKEYVYFDIGTNFLNKVYNYDLATNV
jgi:hypothetical protein